jgi:hypothetical protein
MRYRVLLVALLVLPLSPHGAVAAEYVLRPEQGELVVLVFKAGFASALATGSFEVNQSDFGITPYSLFLGAVRNQDRVRVLFDLVAAP